MQARTLAGQQGQRQLQDLSVKLLVGLSFPKAGEPLIDDIRGKAAKIVNRDRVVRPFLNRIDPLGAIGHKLHPQHRMPHRQLGSGLA